MRLILTLFLLISLTACSTASEHDIRKGFAQAISQGDIPAACEMAAYPSLCYTFWSSRLHGAYSQGQLGLFTLEGDMARFAGGTCFRILVNADKQVVDVRELWGCPASPGYPLGRGADL